MAEAGMTVTATIKKIVLTDDESKKLGRLLTKAQQGDKKALDELRPLVDKAGLWDYVGDLGRRVQESWLGAMTRQNKLACEAYERKLDTMRSELLAGGDSPLERVLVERVLATWLQVSHADMAYSVLLSSDDGYSFKEGVFQQERQDRAHARHLKAVKALASVRRLLVPAVQVNIGKNQIISQGATPGPAEEPQA